MEKMQKLEKKHFDTYEELKSLPEPKNNVIVNKLFPDDKKKKKSNNFLFNKLTLDF